jgi:hypothetical protein
MAALGPTSRLIGTSLLDSVNFVVPVLLRGDCMHVRRRIRAVWLRLRLLTDISWRFYLGDLFEYMDLG